MLGSRSGNGVVTSGNTWARRKAKNKKGGCPRLVALGHMGDWVEEFLRLHCAGVRGGGNKYQGSGFRLMFNHEQ